MQGTHTHDESVIMITGKIQLPQIIGLLQIYAGDSRIGAIFFPAWDSNWEYSGFFRDLNEHDSQGAYVTCICCGLNAKIKRVKHRTVHKDHGHILFAFVSAYVV